MWYKTRWGKVMVLMFILLAIFFIIAIFSFYKLIVGSNSGNAKIDLSTIVGDTVNNSPVRQLAERLDRPTYGNRQAKIILVEFADFRCPMCVKEFPIIREVIDRYKDDLLFVFRQYPIIDEGSLVIGQAALCAGDQGKFWEFHDQIFAKPDSASGLEDLRLLAVSLGLDEKVFVTCLRDEVHKPDLVEDTSAALQLGVRGTPTFFLNGNKIEGVVSLKQWTGVIEGLKSFFNSQTVN